MACIVRREVEILVHSTAPSRGQDDARYRALTQAYLDFEPVHIHRLEDESENDSGEDADIQASSQLQTELEQSTLEERESEASYRPDNDTDAKSIALSSISLQNKDSRLELSQGLESPMLSFNSAVDNADSPAWRGLDTSHQKLPNVEPLSQKDLQESPSEIADSQPEISKTIPAFSSPTRILELYLQQVQSSEERSSLSYGIGGNEEQVGGPSPELPHGIQHSPSAISKRVEEDPSSTSGVPSSPSPQRHREKSSQRISRYRKENMPSTQDPAFLSKRKWAESSLDDSHIPSSAPSKISFESSTVITRMTKSRRRQWTDGSMDEVTQTKEVTSSKVAMVATSSAPSSDAKSVWAEKSEIRPPLPPTSTKDLTSSMLVTPPLQQIADKMSLTTLFRPKYQTRDLRPFERGYWIVNWENWDPGVRKRCWECLGNFIGRSMGGWGVWCIRNEESGTIRVYCWGHVVGHAYLLLYMASESKIKAMGASWIGGDGKAIITMSG